MSSFALTCGVSKLPIHEGHKVRCLLLTQDPYVEDSWIPRTFPLRAAYNDYGTVNQVEEGIGRELWQEGLQLDIKARGHRTKAMRGQHPDTHALVTKDMSWEDLLEAIWAERIRVTSELRDPAETEAPQKTPVGVPTMRRALRLLDGYPQYPDKGYVIDKPSYGQVRIHWEGSAYGAAEKLAAIEPLFARDYATVITAGDDSLGGAQLLIYPKPSIKGFRGWHKESKRGLRVSPLMIREDVWQGLLELPAPPGLGVEAHREGVVAEYTECVEALELASKRYSYLNPLNRPQPESRFRHCPEWLEGGFPVGWGVHWRLLVQKKLPVAAVLPTLHTIGEMTYIAKILRLTRWTWRPSRAGGPQDGEWAEHARVNQLFADIAARQRAQQLYMWDQVRYRGP